MVIAVLMVSKVATFCAADDAAAAATLTDFLEAASAAGAHLWSVNALLPPEVVNNIYGILIRKISHQVRAECGITGSTEAAEVARLLSERYGGAWRPPARSAVKLLRMRRAHGETPSAYMHRVDQAFRLVKAQMAAVEAAGVATAKLAVIEELLREAVLSEMPEKTRRQLKALTNANFGVLLAQVDEEEDDYQAAREDAATWTRVEKRNERRPDRGHETRPTKPSTPGTAGAAGPLAYASKKLTPAESRYSAIERELLGVVWAVEHFRPYVWGRQFRIKTDHKPLVWIEGLRETSARITRWKERLAPYAFQITHTKGRDNVVADCLSRMVNAIDSPSPTLDVHDEVEWDSGNFDLSPGITWGRQPGASGIKSVEEAGRRES
ncbi:hypothetical protein AAG570_012422 [Ranatra chinensis]|uniref:Reverse transcriptase RNase H-like domain-containing protein n=1 Tax=Ranatra chinensis TaxID=642074 RepID=A0ABD0YIR6_9HEMI